MPGNTRKASHLFRSATHSRMGVIGEGHAAHSKFPSHCPRPQRHKRVNRSLRSYRLSGLRYRLLNSCMADPGTLSDGLLFSGATASFLPPSPSMGLVTMPRAAWR